MEANCCGALAPGLTFKKDENKKRIALKQCQPLPRVLTRGKLKMATSLINHDDRDIFLLNSPAPGHSIIFLF